MTTDQRLTAFATRWGHRCQIISSAPGRVNLIGEHTDYNDGYVLPIAIPQRTYVSVAAAPADVGQVRVYSQTLDDELHWPLDGWHEQSARHWSSYVAGIIALLRQRGIEAGGLDLLIDSAVPPGGGLSSSAALEVALASALTRLAGVTLSNRELAELCRQAEHEYAGVPCGVMDQYAVLVAQAGAALLLDCRSLEYEHVPLKLDGHVFLVIDSGVKHELANSEYAQRQRECREAVRILQGADQTVESLRDVDMTLLLKNLDNLPPRVADRARHVITENQRTREAAAAFRAGDLKECGRLMSASHDSLRDDYQVSCQELDLLVEIVKALPGVLGARLTGGGFGGCIVVLAEEDSVVRVEQALRRHYDTNARRSRLMPVQPGAGAIIEYP
ncbi:MAG: galactokinase [Planctomycetota bacterium]